MWSLWIGGASRTLNPTHHLFLQGKREGVTELWRSWGMGWGTRDVRTGSAQLPPTLTNCCQFQRLSSGHPWETRHISGSTAKLQDLEDGTNSGLARAGGMGTQTPTQRSGRAV